MNINDITQSKIYNTAYYEAVEFAGDCVTVNAMKDSLYDYIFGKYPDFDNESDYNIWLLGTIKGYEYAVSTTEFYGIESEL